MADGNTKFRIIFDLPPARGKVIVACRHSPDAMQMVGKQDEGADFEGVPASNGGNRPGKDATRILVGENSSAQIGDQSKKIGGTPLTPTDIPRHAATVSCRGGRCKHLPYYYYVADAWERQVQAVAVLTPGGGRCKHLPYGAHPNPGGSARAFRHELESVRNSPWPPRLQATLF